MIHSVKKLYITSALTAFLLAMPVAGMAQTADDGTGGSVSSNSAVVNTAPSPAPARSVLSTGVVTPSTTTTTTTSQPAPTSVTTGNSATRTNTGSVGVVTTNSNNITPTIGVATRPTTTNVTTTTVGTRPSGGGSVGTGVVVRPPIVVVGNGVVVGTRPIKPQGPKPRPHRGGHSGGIWSNSKMKFCKSPGVNCHVETHIVDGGKSRTFTRTY